MSRQGFIAVIHNDEILILDAKLVPDQHWNSLEELRKV